MSWKNQDHISFSQLKEFWLNFGNFVKGSVKIMYWFHFSFFLSLPFTFNTQTSNVPLSCSNYNSAIMGFKFPTVYRVQGSQTLNITVKTVRGLQHPRNT